MHNLFASLFLKAATWAFVQSLGPKKGAEAIAAAAPILVPLAAAAGEAASVRIDHAAATGGSLYAAFALVDATLSRQP